MGQQVAEIFPYYIGHFIHRRSFRSSIDGETAAHTDKNSKIYVDSEEENKHFQQSEILSAGSYFDAEITLKIRVSSTAAAFISRE